MSVLQVVRLSRVTSLVALGALAAVGACGDGTDPVPLGPLDSRIVQGHDQKVVAGRVPSPALGLVFRNPVTGAVYFRSPALWERVLLPPLAHALQSVGFKGVPNATYCIHQDQTVVKALKPCVNTDALGNSRWDFIEPTVAGKHIVEASATIGTESTAPDTIAFTVLPDVVDPNYTTGTLPLRCSPAQFPINGVRDRYGNAIPFRIVPDGRLTVLGDTAGTTAARTVTFTAAQADTVNQSAFYKMELRDSANILVGRITYRIGTGTGACGDGTNAHRIDWNAAGLNVP
jgi:hypothetical protein